MSPSPGPPRLLARLLEALLPPTGRARAMLGDLHEEHVRRVERGDRRVGLWYLREACGLALRYAGQRRRYRRRGPAGTGHSTLEGTVDEVIRNVRYAVRRLTRAPAFTLVAVASLALGIGANTAMFSLVNAIVIRAQPFEDPATLVDLYQSGEGFSHGVLSYPDYLDLTEASSDVFSAVGGSQFTLVQTDLDEGVEIVPVEAMTGNYFPLLGVRPAVGRLLGDEDHVAPGAHPVVVLGYGYWTTRFGGDPGVVGSEMRLSGRAYTVIGVAPEDFPGTIRGFEPSIFVPILMFDDLEGSASGVIENRGNQSFFAKGRLRTGATLAQARAVAERLQAELRVDYPDDWQPSNAFVLVPTADVIMNPMIDRFIVPAAGMVMTVVGLVLLIACANLASFLLARAADRRKEIALRLALGARRRSLVGQLLTETVLLSTLGGALGVLIAVQALRALETADLPLPLPITLDLTLDPVVLAFSLIVTGVAGLLFGLAPALQGTRPDVAPTLRDESAGAGGTRGARLRDVLVSAQVSVSVVLLVAAGLFLRSLEASRSIDPGFGDAPAALLEVQVSNDRYGQEERSALHAELARRYASIPGVGRVGYVDLMPLNTVSTSTARVMVDGVDAPPDQDFHSVDRGRADSGYFEAMGIDLVAGRLFDATDVPDAEAVMVVTEEFERRFFGEAGATNQVARLNGEEVRVVGVVADHKVRYLGEETRPRLYLAQSQSPTRYGTFVASTSGDAGQLGLRMVAETRATAPDVVVLGVESLERHVATLLLGRELGAMMVTGFATLALLLASIGLYGVVSYAVARRAREVGIRLSLGADAGSVVRMLTGRGLRLVAIGAVVGLAASALLAQLLSRLLYGVPPLDAPTFLGVPLVLGAVALVASWIPARRVTRIDPVGALRSE